MTTYVSATLSLWPSGVAPTQTQVNDWLNSIKAALDTCLVQTSDTGQINMGSPPAWPGGQSTALGYWIYRFNDTRQGTEPIFLKVEPASGGGTTYAKRVYLTIGTGSDGAGNITGITQARFGVNGQISTNTSAPNPSQEQNYACSVDGYFFFLYGLGNQHYAGFPNGWFAITRSRDPSTYAFDGLGYTLHYRSNDAGVCAHWMRTIRTASPAQGRATGRINCIIPGVPANTALLNGDKQLYPNFADWPDIRPVWSIFTVRASEVSTLPTTFSATPIAAGGARTFIHFGTANYASIVGDTYYRSTFNACFLWE